MATGTIQKNMVLLWENPSPTVGFGAQTVQLDLSKYEFVLITFRHFNDNAAERSWLVRKNGVATVCDAPSPSTSANPRRNATATNSGVTFSAGFNDSYAANGIIPIAIYGVNF